MPYEEAEQLVFLKKESPVPYEPPGEVNVFAREPQEKINARVREAMRASAAHQFCYHPPVNDQPKRYAQIRQACLDCARDLIDNGTPSLELSAAIESLREAMMWANASIACHPSSDELLQQGMRQAEQDKATMSADAPR